MLRQAPDFVAQTAPSRRGPQQKSPDSVSNQGLGSSRYGREDDQLLEGVLGRFLHIANRFLGLAFDLLGNTLGLLLPAVDDFTSLLLDLTRGILQGSLDLIFVHILPLLREPPERSND